MSLTEKTCLGCNCSMNPDNSINIDDQEICVDCAADELSVTDITNNDDTFDIVAQNLELEDLINLKTTIKGFPKYKSINRGKKRELLNKNLRTGETQFYDPMRIT